MEKKNFTAKLEGGAIRGDTGKAELSQLSTEFIDALVDEDTDICRLYHEFSVLSHTSKEHFFQQLEKCKLMWLHAIQEAYPDDDPVHKAFECTADAMKFGEQKYNRGNWKKGFKYSSIIDAGMRHCEKIIVLNSTSDNESGLVHYGHIGFAFNCLYYQLKNNVGEFDL